LRLAADANHARYRMRAAHRAQGAGVQVRHTRGAQFAGGSRPQYLQRSRHEWRVHGIDMVAVFIEHGVGAGLERRFIERAQLCQHLVQAGGQRWRLDCRGGQLIEQAAENAAPDRWAGAIDRQHRHAVRHGAAQRVGIGTGHTARCQLVHHGSLGVGQRGHQHQIALHAGVDRNALDIALRQFAQAQRARGKQGLWLRQQQARNGVVVQAFNFTWL